MNICDKCGKEFYSDVDYEQHLFLHQGSALMTLQAEVLGKQAEILNRLFNVLLGAYQFAQVNSIANSLRIPFEEAALMYFSRLEVWNKITAAQKAKDAEEKRKNGGKE